MVVGERGGGAESEMVETPMSLQFERICKKLLVGRTILLLALRNRDENKTFFMGKYGHGDYTGRWSAEVLLLAPIRRGVIGKE